METMDSWINSLVETALRTCLENLKESATDSPEPDWISGPVLDDRSNLRIPVRSPRCVQVVKWAERDPPVQGSLSDSFALIEGIFASNAVREYRRRTKKKLRHGTKGAILKLTDFEVVVSHTTATSPSLYIQNFELSGCEGTGILGNPDSIEKNETILELTRKICQANRNRNRDRNASDEDATDDSDDSNEPDDNSDAISVRSQRQENLLDTLPSQPNGLGSTSQDLCLTQIPNGHAPIEPRGIEVSVNTRSKPNSKDLLSHLSSTNKPSGANSGPHTTSRDPSQTSYGAAADTTSRKNAPRLSEERRQESREQSTPCQGPITSADRPISRNIRSAPVSCGRSNSSSPSQVTNKQNEDCIQASRTPQASNNHSDHDKDIPSSTKPLDLNQQNDTPDIREPAANTPSNISHPHHNGKQGQDLVANVKHNDTWRKWKKIRRRDIIIPSDQEELIESPDSWIPPEAGKQMPQAHIPVNLLRQWNEHQSKRSKPNAPTPPDEVTTEEQECVSPTSSSSPPASSSEELEWSPSPPTLRVPPDSSPPKRFSRPDSRSRRCLPNVSERQEKIDNSGTVDDVIGDGVNAPEARSSAEVLQRDSPRPTVEGDDLDSELETTVPKGSGAVSFQGQGVPITGGLSNSAPPSYSAEKSCFTHNGRSEKASSCSDGARQRTGNGTPRPVHGREDQPSQILSDVLVPATYNSEDIPPRPGPFEVTRGDGPKRSVDTGEDPLSKREPSSELDSSPLSSHMAGQPDPFKTGVSLSQNSGGWTTEADTAENRGDVLDSQESQPTVVSVHKKRKLDDTGSSRSTKLRKVAEKTFVDASEVADPSAGHGRKSLGAENRQAYFSGDTTVSPCRTIYTNFKQAYPEYEGDIQMFKRSCRSLQSLYAGGDLERSVLWDDYVAREPTEYDSYLLECFRHNRSPDTYRIYFLNNVTAPRFKKRNLSAKKITLVVGDDEIDEDEDPESQRSRGDDTSSLNGRPPEPRSPPVRKPSNTAGDQEPSQSFTKEFGDEHGEPERALESNIQGEFEDSDNGEWHECDEIHETASVELGDLDHYPQTSANEQEMAGSVSSDIDMDDAETAVSEVEDASSYTNFAAPDALKRRLSSREAIEIDESDTETAVHRESPRLSSEPNQKRIKVKKGTPESQKTPIAGNKGQEVDDSPDLGESLYPPFMHPPCPAEDAAAQERGETGRIPWWKDPKTQFKEFARAYAGLRSVLGQFRSASDTTWPPVDEDGVIIPGKAGVTSPDKPVEGRMNTMGWGS